MQTNSRYELSCFLLIDHYLAFISSTETNNPLISVSSSMAMGYDEGTIMIKMGDEVETETAGASSKVSFLLTCMKTNSIESTSLAD